MRLRPDSDTRHSDCGAISRCICKKNEWMLDGLTNMSETVEIVL